ncbi:MAG: FAD-dependent oxidoreductase [Deltaproteobacteria bacterium]|nr:MAG: FAD-dependent oxidoreductase [Deltaproteobacteria bacterium]
MMLLEEGYIGNLCLRNRVKFASTTTCFCTKEGRVTEQEKRWLEERAKGGVGLVTTGISHVTPWGRLVPNMLGGWDDSFIADFRELAEAIHSGGAKACLSIGHCGRYTYRREELTDASSVPTRIMTRAEPRQLSETEIAELVRAFGETARRAKVAGFDAVEVCACAGYLLSSFLSPWTNTRTDQYGGSLENRARFSSEVVDAIKSKTGKEFPLVFRMCGDELMPEGSSPEELTNVAKMLEETGVDALSLTVGWHESTVPAITGEIARGHWLYLAERIKKVVKIPTMMAYRVTHTEADKAINAGIIDLWEASRPFIADPEIPQKLAENRPEDIIPCICCCQGCYDNVFQGRPIWCVVNPRAGRESDPEYAIKPAVDRKKVVVIGGGPAGMEAAVIAAKRGHEVTLLEKEDELGGNLQVASIPPFKSDFGDLNRYFVGQMEKQGVLFKLSHEATAQAPEVREADALILATGASPLLPDILGIEGKNVVTALDVLMGMKEVGNGVIIVGGGMVGCETAELLSKKGKNVTVLEMLDRMAGDMGPTLRWRLLSRLREAGVRLETGVEVIRFREDGVEVLRKEQSEFFQADDIILAVGMKSNDGLAQALKAEVPQLYQVGDSLQPRKLGEAMQEAYYVAAKL